MTIREYLDEAVRAVPDAPAQRFCLREVWVTRTYAELYERVVRAVAILRRLQITPGEHHVGLMLENSPEWQEIYLALACVGVAVVPLDPKLRPQEAAYILRDSEAVALFAGSRLGAVLGEAVGSVPDLRACVWVGEDGAPEPLPSLAGVACYGYEALRAETAAEADAARAWFEEARPAADTVASIIYTSGTTGKPKGAMLTHGNFTSNVADTCERVGFRGTDNFLNVLPLFHAFSFTANFMLPLAVKACCSFVRSLRTVSEDMLVLRPTVMLAVPLMAEKLYARIAERLRKNLIARGLLGMGLKKLVSKKVIESFGGRLRLLGIGGAPTPVAVINGFRDVGITVLEGYGLTECSPGVAYPSPDAYRPGTVGRVLSGMRYKLADADETGAGELCVKGPNVMKGYYKNPEATAEVFDDEGFFHTGDLVRLDERQNLTICGRKKALIVNREGKNIYPEEIEQIIEQCPGVRDVVVLGYTDGSDSGERVGVIAVPDMEKLASARPGIAGSEAEAASFLRERIAEFCRQRISDYKMPRKIVIRTEPLERTSTMKVRRAVYAGTLDEAAAPVTAEADDADTML